MQPPARGQISTSPGEGSLSSLPDSDTMLENALQRYRDVPDFMVFGAHDARRVFPFFLTKFLRRQTGRARVPANVIAQAKSNFPDVYEDLLLKGSESDVPPMCATLGHREIGVIRVFIQQGPLSTINLDLSQLNPAPRTQSDVAVAANLTNITDNSIVLQSPWYLNEEVTFEIFLDRRGVDMESTLMRKSHSPVEIQYSLKLPTKTMTALWRSGVRDWSRVAIVAILTLNFQAFRANKCVDYVNGSDEAVAQIWVAFSFKPGTDPTPTANVDELENGSIRRPRGRAVDIAATLDWENNEYKRLQDWLEDKADKVLDPFKTISRQDDNSLRQICDDAVVAFPALKQYEGNWPALTILAAILKRPPLKHRRQRQIQRGLIPKPMGEASGDFVRKNLNWDQAEFDNFSAWLERQAAEKLDLCRYFKAQNPQHVEDIFDAALNEFPILEKYAKLWPVGCELRALLKKHTLRNARAARRRTAGSSASGDQTKKPKS